MAFKSKKKFEYKPRDPEKVKARATASGGHDNILVDGVKVFTPKGGENTVRILPPTWDDANHYGLDVEVHYRIGADGGAYLCLKMNDEECPICKDRLRAEKEDDEALVDHLKPRRQVLTYVIDRNNEKDGPLVWKMPFQLDREISKQSVDRKTQELLNLDDPDEGYDVSFVKEGEGIKTKYTGVQLERRSSPLSDDEDTAEEWLDKVKEYPIDELLNFQTEEYLDDIVGEGLTAPKEARDRAKQQKGDKEDDRRPRRRGRDEDEEDERRPSKPKRSSRDDDDDDDKPRKPKRSRDEDEEEEERPRKAKLGSKKKKIDTEDLDWKSVHAMDEDELLALAEQEDIDISEAETEEEAADAICESLDIKKPSSKPAGLKKRLGR